MSLEKKRLSYVDWFKAIGISLIVLGHCLPAYTMLRTVIYAFHVPLFAFAGGFLAKPTKSLRECLKKIGSTLSRIGIPYLIWFVVMSYPYMMAECPIKTDYTFKQLVEIFFLLNGRPMWNAALWFIPPYLIVSIVFILFAYLVRGNRIACAALGACGFAGIITLELTDKTVDLFGYTNIFSMHNILLLLGFYCVGYLLKEPIRMIAERKSEPYKNYMLYIGLAALIVSLIVCARVNTDPSKPGGYYGMSVLNLNYNNIYIYIALGTAILVSLLISCALLPEVKSATMFSQSSFFIMATHYWFFRSPYYVSTNWKENKWQASLHSGIKQAFYMILVYMILLYVLYYIRERSKIASRALRYLGI